MVHRPRLAPFQLPQPPLPLYEGHKVQIHVCLRGRRLGGPCLRGGLVDGVDRGGAGGGGLQVPATLLSLQ